MRTACERIRPRRSPCVPGRARPGSVLRRLGAVLALLAAAALAGAPSPAAASVDAGQILVRSDDAGAVADAVAAWLERFAARADATEDPLWVAREGARRVVVLPPVDGWILILEGAGDRADRALAAHLARALETEAIWIEVAGSRLAWRHAHHRGERRVSAGQAPAAAFADGFAGEMPAYDDAEHRAWEWLGERGVPTAHRLVRTGDVQRARPDDPRGVAAVLFRVARAGEGLEVTRDPARVRPPGRGDAPPVVFDTLLPGTARPEANDPGQAIDLIRLVGTPTEASVDRLAGVFDGIRARYVAGGGRFCHLVEDAYRVAVYERLARDEGPCRDLYTRMLSRAREEAEGGPPRRPPPRRPAP